jgi:type VI secretion system protein ImpC
MQISFTHGPSALPRAPAYRTLVLGDFDPEGAARHRGPIRIDRAGFNTVLDAVAPILSLDLDNALSDRAETWWLKLQLRSLADFTPEGLLRSIPELDWIDRLRQTINEVAAGRTPPGRLRDLLDDYTGIPALADAISHCRQALSTGEPPPEPQPKTTTSAPPPMPSAPSDGDSLDRLFDMIDAGKDGEDTSGPKPKSGASSAIGGAVAAMRRREGQRRPISGLDAASARVTELLERQVRLILAHPRFIALEQAWRGLRWLLKGVGGDVPVDVQFLPCQLADAAEAITRAKPTAAEGAGETTSSGFDLILADFSIGTQDLDQVLAIADAAETNMTPVLLTLDDGFLLPPTDTPLAKVRDPANLLDQPAYQLWNARRDAPALRWLGCCFNDMLLRAPYQTDTRHGAGITQPPQALRHGLWGHAGWLAARRVIEQQQQTDWPAPITGARNGRIEDLDLVDPGDGTQRPLRHLLLPEQAEDLGRVGIIALACAEDQDSAWIVAAPSLLRIQPQAQPEQTRQLRRDASLSFQLVRARLAQCIIGAMDRLAGGTARDTAMALERYADGLVAATGPSAGASVSQADDHPGQLLLTIRIGEQVASGLTVEMQLRV